MQVAMMIGLLISAQGPGSPPLPKVTACEALSNLAAYNGKIIELTGVGMGLFVHVGPDCDVRINTKGYIWPSEIGIVSPVEESKYAESRAPFREDRETIHKAREVAWRRVPADFSRGRIEVTYEGLLVTAPNLAERVASVPPGGPHQRWIVTGFGVQNRAPAHLLVKTVRRIVYIERDQKTVLWP